MIKNITTIFIIAITIASCTEKMDINLGTTYTRLVVSGHVTPLQGEQYIKLTKTADYFANEPPPPVTGATVTVDDGTFTTPFTEDTINKGYYRAPDGFLGISGITYQLNIDLSEPIVGETHFSATEKMPQLIDNIDSIIVEKNPNFKKWMVRLYALDPPATNFYMFNGLRNGKIITDSVSRVRVSDDRLYNGNYTNGTVVLVLNEDELSPGDIFTLELSNITEEYANFILDLQAEIRPHDPMFSGPPANVSTNITNGAVGFFAAYPSAFSSTVVKSQQ